MKKEKTPRTNRCVQQGHKLQDQHIKINVFLNISNEYLESDIKNTKPFIIAQKSEIGVNLIKHV